MYSATFILYSIGLISCVINGSTGSDLKESESELNAPSIIARVLKEIPPIFFGPLQPYFTREDCLAPVQATTCSIPQIVYTWDHNAQNCLPVTYGGCDPTNNNFPNVNECWGTAGPLCHGYRFSLLEKLKILTKNFLCKRMSLPSCNY